MKLWYSPYELKSQRGFLGSKDSVGIRHGALLKIEFEKDFVGYSDLHVWPELGDKDLNEQLNYLKQKNVCTDVLKKSTHRAKLDAEARRNSKSLATFIPDLANHYLIPDLNELQNEETLKMIAQQMSSFGFDTIKVKVGKNLKKEFLALETYWRRLCDFASKVIHVRIDFNETQSVDAIKDALNLISVELKASLDFFEDPSPYLADEWSSLKKQTGVRLALDRPLVNNPTQVGPGVDIVVVKPAITDLSSELLSKSFNNKDFCVTSYLGHPMGQIADAYESGLLIERGANLICGGLASHLVYESSAFSERLEVSQSRLRLLEPGIGFGFGDLLEKQNWKRLDQ